MGTNTIGKFVFLLCERILRLRLPVPSMSPLFIPFKKWVQCRAMMLVTHNVKKIKNVVHSNGDIDGTCKRALRRRVYRLADSENVFGASHAHPAGKYCCESTSNVTLYPFISTTQRYWDKSATIMSHWGKPCPFIRSIIRTERKIPNFTWVAL